MLESLKKRLQHRFCQNSYNEGSQIEFCQSSASQGSQQGSTKGLQNRFGKGGLKCHSIWWFMRGGKIGLCQGSFNKGSQHRLLPRQNYRIYSAIRRGFPSLDWVQIIKSVLCNFAVIRVLPFLNNPKDLDPSDKMDLDFWDCFGRKKHCLISEEIQYWRVTT